MAFDFKCNMGAYMAEEARTDAFHEEHKIRMEDKFYTQSNWIMKEAMLSAGLDLRQDKLPVERERIGLIIASISEPLQNMLMLEKLRGGKLVTTTTFGLTGALSLEYNIKGYQGMNGNACAASLYSLGDAYRMIKDGY
jgi:3-oxoacyl-(acyl-carrier-protein) synthase